MQRRAVGVTSGREAARALLSGYQPFTCSPALGTWAIAPERRGKWMRKLGRGSVAMHVGPSHNDDGDGEDDEAAVPGKPMRVERLLANLGYGKRRDCQTLVKKGRITRRDGSRLKVGDKVCHEEVVLDGEALDPPPPLTLLLHKPVGYVVTSPEDERVSDPKIYDLLPYRYGARKPFLSAIGRLDKDTSGLLILTDDGQLVHRVKSPRQGIWKVYEARLAAPLAGKEAAAAARRFAAGTLVLQGDLTPLLPAALHMVDDTTARLAICEGRYHQVRRMFAALGHEVVALHRSSVGGLSLGELREGAWRVLAPTEVDAVFAGPTTEQVMSDQDSAVGPLQAAAPGGASKLPQPSAVPDDSPDAAPLALAMARLAPDVRTQQAARKRVRRRVLRPD